MPGALSRHNSRRRRRRTIALVGLLAALVLISSAPPAAAQSFNRSLPLYFVDEGNNLLRTVDPLTGATLTSVQMVDADGNVDIEAALALAVHPTTGELFASLQVTGPSFVLATIDPSTDPAQASIIGPVMLGVDSLQIVDLTFAPDGTLYGVNDTASTPPSELVTINLGTAAAASVVSLNQFGAGQDGNAIAFNPEDNLIYHATLDLGGIPDPLPFMQTLDPAAADVAASKSVVTLLGDFFGTLRGMDYFGNGTLLLYNSGRVLLLAKVGGEVRRLSQVAFFAGGLTFAGLAPACPPFQRLYGAAHIGSNGPGLFYAIDPADGTPTLIGPIGFERVGAMDFLSDGTLIAIGETQDGNNTGTTIEIDPCTGLGAAIGPTGAASFQDISANSSDNVFGATDGATDLASVNTGTGAAAVVNPFDPLSGGGGGLAFDAANTLMLVSTCNPAVLSTVNPADATRSNLFALGNDLAVEECARVNAMDFDPASGTLFGSLVDGGDNFTTPRRNFLATIDTTFFDVVTVGSTQEGLDALAFNSVVADLELAKVAVPDTVDIGVNVTFTLTVTNNGPNAATNVVVSDDIPTGFNVNTVTPSVGNCAGADPINCTIASLANGASATIVIDGSFTSDGALDNIATVTSDTTDPDTSNNTATATVMVGDLANLGIDKVASPPRAVAGDQVTFTLTVRNFGPGDATNVVVTDDFTLSNDFAIDTVTPSQGTCMDFLTCQLGDLANGATATIQIVVTTNVSGTLPNTATVSADQTDPVPANNSVTVNVTPSLADLEITKVADPPAAATGDVVTFTLTVTNNGPDTATNVVVLDDLTVSNDLTLEMATPSQGVCMDFLTCELGDLLNGESATIEVFVTTNVTATIPNTATVSSDQDDPDASNNSDTATIVPSVADLSITKTIAPGQGFIGDDITFTLTIRNNGPDAATSVAVTDVLSDDFILKTSTPSQGTCMGFVTCALGTLASGATATVKIVLAAGVAGTLSNTASVAAAQNDPNSNNNSSTATVTVEVVPAFTVSVAATSATILAGQTASYTVTVATTAGTVGGVGLSCVNISGPFSINCAFNPAAVTPGTGMATSALTVSHGAIALLGAPPGPRPTAPLYAALWLGLPVLVLFGLSPLLRGRRRLAYALAMTLILLAMLLPLAGCNQGEQFTTATFQVRGTLGNTTVNSGTVTLIVVRQP